MTQPSSPQAPVLDIVSFGFKLILKHIKPLSLLVGPILFMGGMSNGLALMGMYSEIDPTLKVGVLILGGLGAVLSAIMLGFSYYSIARYVRDVFNDSVEDNILTYFIPHMDLLGLIGLNLMLFVVAIPAMIGILLGALFLIVPGVMLGSLFQVWCGLARVYYLKYTEDGVFHALKESFLLMKGNFLRVIGLGLAAGLVSSILTMPFQFFNMGTRALELLPPSISHSIWFPIAYGFIYVLASWGAVIVGYGGMMCVLNRFVVDLEDRQNPTPPVVPLQQFRPTPVETRHQA